MLNYVNIGASKAGNMPNLPAYLGGRGQINSANAAKKTAKAMRFVHARNENGWRGIARSLMNAEIVPVVNAPPKSKKPAAVRKSRAKVSVAK